MDWNLGALNTPYVAVFKDAKKPEAERSADFAAQSADLVAQLKILDGLIAGKSWFALDRFTLADISARPGRRALPRLPDREAGVAGADALDEGDRDASGFRRRDRQQAERAQCRMTVAEPRKSFDYIIIGAGSAGCTLANRLSADPDVRVLVLEAGGWDRHPFVKLPLDLGQGAARPHLRLGLRRRAAGHDGGTAHRMRARQGDRRFVDHQRHGLCARQSRRLCALGVLWPARLVLRRRAALFPQTGELGRRRERLSRRRRAAGDAQVAISGSAGRRLSAGRGRVRICVKRRL